MVLSANLWRTPVTLLTGFLGAGKTTLLNRILTGEKKRRLAVLVNDFGSLNIDRMLVQNLDGNMMTLEGGCVCCQLKNDLVNSLLKILALRPDHILIEASGIANPYTLLQTLRRPVFTQGIRLESIIALVDINYLPQVSQPEGKINYQDLLIDQISAADIVIVNKIDLADENQQKNARQIIPKIAPWARLLEASYGDVPLDLLLGCNDSSISNLSVSNSALDRSSQFFTWSYQSDRPFHLVALRKELGKLPVTVLRSKGILLTVEYPEQPVILQQVGPRITLEIGEKWGNISPYTKLVFISAESIDTNRLQHLLTQVAS